MSDTDAPPSEPEAPVSQPDAPPSLLRRLWKVARAALPIVGLAVGLGILFALVDVRGAWNALLSADPWWLAAAVGLAINASLIVAVKVWAIVRIVKLPRSLRQTWSAVMAGVTLNAVVPGRGGDLIRAVFLTREPGSFPLLLGAVLVERLIDIGTIGLLVLLTGVGLDWVTLLALGVVCAAVGGATLLAVLGPRSPIRPDLGERIAQTARRALSRWPYLLASIVLSLLAWANNAALMLCAMRAVGVTVPTLPALRASALSILAGIVPVSISGIGTRDTVLVLFLDSYGQGDALAAAALIYTALVYWFLALVGAAALGPQSLRTVRRLAASRRKDAAPPTG